jgi:hypothetical protein
MNYITISTKGQITGILTQLRLRKSPLPFDWVHTNIDIITACFEDNFKQYHCNLQNNEDSSTYNTTTKSVVDTYGLIFTKEIIPDMSEHSKNDTDTQNMSLIIDSIIDNKYKQRVDYFNHIMNDPTPIICLCNYPILDVIKLQELFEKYYNRINNLYIINIAGTNPTTDTTVLSEYPYIYHVNMNTDNIDIWKYMIDLVLRHSITNKTK